MFQSLGVRNYRLYAAGAVVSLTGLWAQMIAQDWLVLELSGNSGTALGLVTALQFVPVLLLTLWGGVIADRLDKRKILFATQAALGLLALAMGALVVSDAVRLWHVYVFAALLGTVAALDTPTRQSFVSEMVGPDRLPNAVALNSAVFNSARLVGPAVGGLVIAGFGVGPAFLLNGVTAIAVLTAIVAMRPGELLRGTRMPRAGGQLLEGLRYVRGRPDLLLVVTLMGVIGTMGVNFNLTLPLLAKAEFAVGAASFGLLTSAFAGGALVGALVGSRRRGRPSAVLLLSLAALFGLLEVLVAFAPTFAIAALVLVPTGAFLIGHNNVANARVQLGTPARLRGRVMSLYLLVFLGGTPVGALLVGWISDQFGARAGLVVGGASVLAAVGVLALVRLRRNGMKVRLHRLPRPHVHLVGGEAGEVRIPPARPRTAPRDSEVA